MSRALAARGTLHRASLVLASQVLALFVLATFSGAIPALARIADEEANWSRFRGPNGTGQADRDVFPANWSEQDYLWKRALPGVGNSSPVGWGNRLWVSSGDPQTGTATLVSFDTDNGKRLWERHFGGGTVAMHARNSYASATPALDAGQVYFAWAAAGEIHLAALTHAGQQQWRISVGRFEGPHGFAASPMVVDGVVCLQCDQAEDGYLVGVDATTGKPLWRVDRPPGKASYATPCVISAEFEGSPVRAVIVQSMTAGMQAIEVQSGSVVWELPHVLPARCVSSPLLADTLLVGICGSGRRGKSLVGVTLAGERGQAPSTTLTLSKNLPYVPTPVVRDRLLFLWQDRGTVACIDLDDGQPVWQERVGGNFFGSPILAGAKLYCISTTGNVVVLAADREFAKLGEIELGESSNATPAVHRGRMYLRTASTLACLPAQEKNE